MLMEAKHGNTTFLTLLPYQRKFHLEKCSAILAYFSVKKRVEKQWKKSKIKRAIQSSFSNASGKSRF